MLQLRCYRPSMDKVECFVVVINCYTVITSQLVVESLLLLDLSQQNRSSLHIRLVASI